jgi:hypothetical protein
VLRIRRILAVLLTSSVAVLLPGSTLTAGAVVAAPPVQTGACTTRATFISDLTIPDNTVIPAGQTFMKTWRLRNDGSCPWGPGQTVDSLVLVGGHAMGSTTTVPIDVRINPGQTGSVSVTLAAPTTAGKYRSEWKLRRTNGLAFGLGATGATPFYVQIIVGNAPPPPAGTRIQFASGATVASVQGTVRAGETRTYLLRALGGQTMTMAIVSAHERANFAITGVTDGQPYKRVVLEDRYFSLVLPSTQDYRVDVQSYEGTASFVLSVAISPR